MMALSPRLELRQSQSLIMTPQLMQAIKLLQLSNLDLTTYVAEEVERNPLLDHDESAATTREENPGDDGGTAVREPQTRDDGWIETPLPETRGEIEAGLGTELGNVFPDERSESLRLESVGLSRSYGEAGGAGTGSGDFEPNLEAYVASEATLSEHLEAQLALAVNDSQQRMIGRTLIDSIDGAGYLTAPLPDIAEQLGTGIADVERVLAVIHTFDPSGIGARSLQECLSIQLRERDRFDPAMATLIGHLDLLARRDFPSLKRLCGVDDEDLADMIAEIRQLSPKPGLAIGGDLLQVVVPDVLVRAAPDGSWVIELNPDTLPRVLVNQTYYAKVSKTAKDPKEKSFLAECLQNANWLTRSLEQRARTILKVATEIVRQQDGFLTHGISYLRPLNLRMVADVIGMHESTVSRVTANKFMATPRGIFELKYFFTASIASSAGGEAHSAEAVRHRIRQMIDAEPAKDVLSDDAIVQRLRDGGIDIARRTVAKYRESMGIASSVQRRREKTAHR